MTDILALEARVQQLEEALQLINMRVIAKLMGPAPEVGVSEWRYKGSLTSDLNKALSTPAPDVSPLWRHLASSIKVARNTIEPNEPIDLYWDEFVASAKALTPELRSLIETMAKGGKV